MRKYLFLFFLLHFFRTDTTNSQDISSIVQDTIKLESYSPANLDTNNFNVFPRLYSKKKIALVLSGGGARGISQLGVISELEKNNVRIDMVVGTSMGSLIGGFYSSGYGVREIRNILNKLNWNKALSLTNKYQRTSLFLEQKKIQDRSLLTIPLDGIKPVLLPSSLSNGLYLSEIINSYILNSRYHSKINFMDLKIPFTAVATDLDNGKKVILNKGNLSESIKASLTFPLLYTPIRIDNRNLVDGGLSANIPNDVAKDLGADLTIVVNTTSLLKSDKELEDPLNTADQILSIAMEQLNNLQLKDANIIITPDLHNYSSTDFSNIDYLISKGKESTKSLIDTIISRIDSLELSESNYFNNFVINPKVEVNSNIIDPGLNDTLEILTDKYFEKYTSIEKNLKMVYKSGLYNKVYATVTRIGVNAIITYTLISNPVLKSVIVKASHNLIDSLVDNFRKNNIDKPVNVYSYLKFYDDLLGAYRKKSYSLIDIDKFYFDHSNNSLNIEFSSGKIRDIDLSGNKVTNNNVILREINVDTGIPVRKNNLDVSIKNVMSTNLFRQVSFDFVYNKKFLLPVLKIKLIEKNTKALRFSLKVDNERNLQLLLDIRDENIFGSAVEAGVLGAGGLRNRIYQFEIKSNQFFNLPLTFNYNLYYNFRDINRYTQSIDTLSNQFSVNQIGEYRDVKYGMSFLLGTQLERFGTIYGQVIAEKQQIKNKFDSENLVEELKVIKLKFGGIFDTQDRLPFPTRGILINLFYETAKNISESNFSYIKFFADYEQYFPIAKSQTLKPRFIFGFGDRTAPLTEQFSLGGEKSFFGMVEDELRGRQILSTSLEYRYMFPYKIFFDTYFILRYDLGNVWQVTEDIRFKDLRHGIGFTAAFDTPIGEANFSVGKSFIIKKGLTKDSFIFGPYNFYFSIGYDI